VTSDRRRESPDGGHETTPGPSLTASRDSMWNLQSLAECLLATPKGAPINEGLARDLARAGIAAYEALYVIANASTLYPSFPTGYTGEARQLQDVAREVVGVDE
jgi:hypothetical protein